MHRRWGRWMASIGALLLAAACGSSSKPSPKHSCTPGQSVACTGPGGCAGGQMCAADGSGYGACDCSTPADSGSPKDAEAGGDSAPETGTDSAPETGTDAASDSAPETGTDAASDSGSKADSGGDAGGWTPAGLKGLLLWVRGDDLGANGTSIATWPDDSGNQIDLPSDSANQPTVHAAAIGGRSAAAFMAPAHERFNVSSSLLGIGSDNFVVEVVTEVGSCTSLCPIVVWGGGSDAVLIDSQAGQVSGLFSGTATDESVVTLASGAHVVGLRRVSSTVGEIRVDGVATTIPLTVTHSITGSAELLVGNDASGDYFDGDVAEMVIVDSPTVSDVTALEGYLKAKYGL